jgi:hypothetical protein
VGQMASQARSRSLIASDRGNSCSCERSEVSRLRVRHEELLIHPFFRRGMAILVHSVLQIASSRFRPSSIAGQ